MVTLRRRLALGLSPIPRSSVVILLFGLAFGPHGLGVLSASVLASLDPAVSVALAALGVFVGLECRIRRPREGRLLAAASLESAVTILVVVAGVILVHSLSSLADGAPWLLALLLGICAASSSTDADENADAGYALAMRVGDLDDVLPILLGALALAWAHQPMSLALVSFIGQSAGVSALIALATWLLITQTPSANEQRVFVIGALLLLGGAAAHLSLSALLAGFVAGLLWNVIGPPAVDSIMRDMRYLQHPLVVLLLVVAGARLTFPTALVGLAVVYVVFRTAGKLLGGWLARRAAIDTLPRDFGVVLSSPGVVAIAIAIDVLQARGGSETASTLFAIVVVGSVGAEVLSLMAARRGQPA